MIQRHPRGEGKEKQKRENSVVRKGKTILGREECKNTGRWVLEPKFALVSVTVVLNLVLLLFQEHFGYGSLWKKILEKSILSRYSLELFVWWVVGLHQILLKFIYLFWVEVVHSLKRLSQSFWTSLCHRVFYSVISWDENKFGNLGISFLGREVPVLNRWSWVLREVCLANIFQPVTVLFHELPVPLPVLSTLGGNIAINSNK